MLNRLLDNAGSTRPNKFTRAMGQLIRQAREERGMSQEELARQIHRRRPSLSEMENGKMEPDASTLVYLAFALEKPLSYFFPDFYVSRLPQREGELSVREQELLMAFRRLDDAMSQKVAIQQIRALAGMRSEEGE